MSETRIVLVKPGDVLVFGNVGQVPEDAVEVFAKLKDLLSLRQIVVFGEDIDMAAVQA